MLWISPDDTLDLKKQLPALVDLCEFQNQSGNYFVFAYPWFHVNWEQTDMTKLVNTHETFQLDWDVKDDVYLLRLFLF